MAAARERIPAIKPRRTPRMPQALRRAHGARVAPVATQGVREVEEWDRRTPRT
jgi:hypothetical protein